MRQKDEGILSAVSMDGGGEPLNPQINGSEKGTLFGAWIGTAILGIVMVTFFWHAQVPWFIGKMPDPVAWVMAAVVAIALARSIKETIRLKRFGDPILELTAVPVPIGGTLEGRINLGPTFMKGPDFTTKLQCIHRYHQSTGKGSHDVEKVLWSGEGNAKLLPGGIVPISIDLPKDQPDTNDGNPFDSLIWRLTVTAPFAGIAFVEKYEIPVRNSSESGVKDPVQTDEPFGVPTQPLTRGQEVSNTLFLGAFFLGVLGAGLYFLYYAVADIAKANASTGWPVVAGQVSESEIDDPRGSPSPRLNYDYTVNGTPFSGSKVYPHWFWTDGSAQRVVDALPRGSTVKVHYSPDNPSDACLWPGLIPGVFQGLLVATLLLSLAAVLGASCLSSKYAVASGNTTYFKTGSPAGKINGPVLLSMVIQGLLLWWIT